MATVTVYTVKAGTPVTAFRGVKRVPGVTTLSEDFVGFLKADVTPCGLEGKFLQVFAKGNRSVICLSSDVWESQAEVPDVPTPAPAKVRCRLCRLTPARTCRKCK